MVPDAVDGRDAGAHRGAVEMHRAGAAQRHAAAEFRAGHAEHVAQHPKQRRVRSTSTAWSAPLILMVKAMAVPCGWWFGDCDVERRLHARNASWTSAHDVENRGFLEKCGARRKPRGYRYRTNARTRACGALRRLFWIPIAGAVVSVEDTERDIDPESLDRIFRGSRLIPDCNNHDKTETHAITSIERLSALALKNMRDHSEHGQSFRTRVRTCTRARAQRWKKNSSGRFPHRPHGNNRGTTNGHTVKRA